MSKVRCRLDERDSWIGKTWIPSQMGSFATLVICWRDGATTCMFRHHTVYYDPKKLAVALYKTIGSPFPSSSTQTTIVLSVRFMIWSVSQTVPFYLILSCMEIIYLQRPAKISRFERNQLAHFSIVKISRITKWLLLWLDY